MEKLFAGKIALVTGGSYGIGRATAQAFAERGATVVIADNIEDKERTTLASIEALGAQAMFIHCDVSNSGDVTHLIDTLYSSYGRLDFAFNNAGIEGIQAPTHECTHDNWERVLAVNLTGVWLCMKHQLQHMLRHGKGAIVNCASIAGLVGFPGLPAYTASKHAIVGLTKTAALENARTGIRINAVCPGVIKTPMIDRFTGNNPAIEQQFAAQEPMGRLGSPREVAEAVVWLCSDAASFITGQALAVDGGWTVA
jgi:NAD(P)-dependent dehydrogenase (short-subunit alcohol dehydrogenase family)